MKNKKGFIGFLVYVFVLFFTITGFIVALNNAVQINAEGGSQDTNTAGVKDGVKVSKTISPTDTENFFDITLTVETSSNIQNLVTEPDVAVVIVLDISRTMIQFDVSDSSTKRLEAARSASESLINEFYKEAAKAPSAERKLGFVAFNSHGHEIFGLQDCNNKTKADELIAEMKSDTKAIVDKYDGSSTQFYNDRWTNVEAGLKRAQDMLATSAISNSNKYIILLSDGLPTTYLKNSNGTDYIGYSPLMNSHNPDFAGLTEKNASVNGTFYNERTNELSTDGVNYSDRGAIKARERATIIKNLGIEIFTVGVGLSSSNVDTVAGTGYIVDVDKETYVANGNKYEVERAGSQNFKDWLEDSIGSGDGHYYDTNSLSALTQAFINIFTKITNELKLSTEGTWVANDPMGMDGSVENIEFVGFYDDANPGVLHSSLKDKNDDGTDNPTQSDTASYKSSGQEISWDLKKSSYELTTVGTETYYKYQIVYRIRLENELSSFVEGKVYNTNEETLLTYVVREENQTTGEDLLSNNKTISFPIPSVVGYLGEFSFTKKSSYGDKNLKGAKFKLEHKADCTCHNGYIANMTDKSVTVSDKYATSDENGLVSFSNIPSGHQYTLTEVEVPKDHIKADDHDIVVAYGVTTGNPDDNILVNTIKSGNLEITKRVEGNDEYSGKFKFKLEIDFDGADLTDGPYEYKIINGNGETVDSGKTNFASKEIELEKDQTYIIYKLPVGAVYTLQELTTNGYKVKYAVNSNEPSDLVIGDKATCNSTNSCRIENGGNNEVLFVNIAGYILPATGSSGMLIMTIIGLLLLIVPVIYIGYSFYKNVKKSGLTS